MDIVVLGINYWPEETGIGPYTTGLCEHLALYDHRVTMVTGLPYYPEWRVPRSYRHRLGNSEFRNGVTIHRSWLYVPRHVTPKRRILHEASFIGLALLKVFVQTWTNRPDLILIISPPLGLTMCAIILGRMWKVPFAMQVEDLQPDAAIDLGMLKTGRVTQMLFKMEQTAYRHARLISTLTPGMRERILSKGVPPNKVTTIAHGVEDSLFTIPFRSEGTAVRKRFGLGGKFLVIHSGNMGVKQGLEVVLEAAQRSGHYTNILYLLIGDGAVRTSLQDRVARLGLNNVRFLPVQPRDVFHELLATTSVALITQRRTVADIAFPSKAQTLLASGRPVVASVSAGSEVARAICEAEAGLIVAPEEPDALLEAILKLRDDSGLRIAMASKGREYAQKHWSHEQQLRLMEKKLCDLIVAPQLSIQQETGEVENTGPEQLEA
jgi:colanic acid biosynthesis glycosyl transferase WcaI